MTKVHVFEKRINGEKITLALSEKDDNWEETFDQYVDEGWKYTKVEIFK